MIASIVNTLKTIFFTMFGWGLTALKFGGVVFFGVTIYTLYKYSKNPRSISKKAALIAAAVSLVGVGVFGYLMRIDIRTDILSATTSLLPFKTGAMTKYLEYVVGGGFLLLGSFLGKIFFKTQEISGEAKNYTIKGSPIYLLLWSATFGLLQIGYLFNLGVVIKYAIPLTLITTLSMIFMNLYIYKKLSKVKKELRTEGEKES